MCELIYLNETTGFLRFEGENIFSDIYMHKQLLYES